MGMPYWLPQKGMPYWLPHFVQACPCALTQSVWCSYSSFVFFIDELREQSHPTLEAGVPLGMSGSILHQVRWWLAIKNLDTEGCTPITYPQWSCCHDSVPWVVMVVIPSAIWRRLWAGDVYSSAKHMQSCRHPLPLHVTWSHHPSSVDTLVDVHGRSHSFPLIHPREVFLAWCWVIARPLSSHGVFSLSLLLGVGLSGVGLVHLSHAWWTPTHKGMPVSDVTRRSWLQCRMRDCPCWSVTLYEGNLLWSDTPPHEAHPPTGLQSSSFPERHQPSLRQDHQASDPQHLSFGLSTISVFGLLLLTGPELPRVQPSIGHGQ